MEEVLLPVLSRDEAEPAVRHDLLDSPLGHSSNSPSRTLARTHGSVREEKLQDLGERALWRTLLEWYQSYGIRSRVPASASCRRLPTTAHAMPRPTPATNQPVQPRQPRASRSKPASVRITATMNQTSRVTADRPSERPPLRSVAGPPPPRGGRGVAGSLRTGARRRAGAVGLDAAAFEHDRRAVVGPRRFDA